MQLSLRSPFWWTWNPCIMLGVRPLRSRLNTAASEAELWLMVTVPVISPDPSVPENVHTADLAEVAVVGAEVEVGAAVV